MYLVLRHHRHLDKYKTLDAQHLRVSSNYRVYHSKFLLLCISRQANTLEPGIGSLLLTRMRLIDTATLELHEFHSDKTPRYAILSHRWQDGEVSYKEFRKRRNLEKQGWQKIRAFCESAREGSYPYVWIYTCCT